MALLRSVFRADTESHAQCVTQRECNTIFPPYEFVSVSSVTKFLPSLHVCAIDAMRIFAEDVFEKNIAHDIIVILLLYYESIIIVGNIFGYKY